MAKKKKKKQRDFIVDDNTIETKDTIREIVAEFSDISIDLKGDRQLSKLNCECISTQVPLLDKALGRGLPVGRMVEIYGEESQGKSTLVLHVIAEIQRKGGVAILLDSESSLIPEYAEAIGIDLERLIYFQPETVEEVFEKIHMMVDKIKEKWPNVLIGIFWDTVAGTSTESEIEGDSMDKTQPAEHARIIAKELRKVTRKIKKCRILMVFVNQLKSKIGIIYGAKTTTFGGKAIKYHASIRFVVQKIQILKKGEDAYGIRCKVRVEKNKIFAPYKVAEFDIIFGEGIDLIGARIEYLIEKELIKQKGQWLIYNEVERFNKKTFSETYRKNRKFRKEIKKLTKVE